MNWKWHLFPSVGIAIVFIILRLTGVISWGWLAVLSPFSVAGFSLLMIALIKRVTSKEETREALSGIISPISLTAVFTVLKLRGEIDWAWWQVTLPLLIVIGVSLLVFVVLGLTGRLSGKKKEK